MPAKTSAGLLMFRKIGSGLEVLLAHPSGPFFKNKDDGVWTIPKGVAESGEDLLERAWIDTEGEIAQDLGPESVTQSHVFEPDHPASPPESDARATATARPRLGPYRLRIR